MLKKKKIGKTNKKTRKNTKPLKNNVSLHCKTEINISQDKVLFWKAKKQKTINNFKYLR